MTMRWLLIMISHPGFYSGLGFSHHLQPFVLELFTSLGSFAHVLEAEMTKHHHLVAEGARGLHLPHAFCSRVHHNSSRLRRPVCYYSSPFVFVVACFFRIVLGSFETGVRWSNGIGPAYRQQDALKFHSNPASSSDVAVTMLAHEADRDRILKLSGALRVDLQHPQRRMEHGPSRTTSEEVLCDPAFEVERAPDIGLILTQEDVHHYSRAGIPLATFCLHMRVGMSKNAKQQVRRLKKDNM